MRARTWAVASAMTGAMFVASFGFVGCTPGSDDDANENSGETSPDTGTTPPPAGVDDDDVDVEDEGAGESDETSPPTESAPDPGPDAYISTFDPAGGSDLYQLSDGEVEAVTSLRADGGSVQLTDIARSPGGLLYGSTFTELVRIDTASGDVDVIAPFSTAAQVNALTFLADGRLLAADLEGSVSFIDVETGLAERVADYPSGLLSSGDLVQGVDGTVYGTATDRQTDHLLAIDLETGEVEVRSSQLPVAVYGLIATPDGGLIGLTYVAASVNCDLGQLVAINVDGSGYEPLDCLDISPGGAAGR